MKTFIFLLCTTVFAFTTENSLAQKKVTIDADDEVSIEGVFDIIKKQTDYRFLYPQDLFKDAPKVQLKKGIIRVDKLLNQSLGAGKFNVVVSENNTIIIKNFKSEQERLVSGQVTDESGLPLLGVTVLIKGTTTGTSTDFDGKYAITVANPENVLVFSALGFAEQEIAVGDKRNINVSLKEQASELGEVVVNAGYYKVKDKERTGSISHITAKNIEIQPVMNALATMQGSMAGVDITQTTGIPGGAFTIKIRGQNSLRRTGNDPLFVIDGIPYSSESIGSFSTSIIFGGEVSPLNSLNPDTIESIEVLKDADATAIYGSRGANGVVLITTKKGKIGKPSFNISYSSGIGRVTRFMDLMKTEQYIAMRKEAYENDGVVNYPANAYDVNGTWDQSRYTDWQKELTGGTAEYTNITTSISGGNAQSQFLLGGSFLKQTTVFPGDFRYKKGNFNMSANHESQDKKLGISFSAVYALQDNNQLYVDLTRDSRLLAPNAPEVYDNEGNLNWENNTFNTNPLRHLNGGYDARTYDLISNATLSYQLFKNIQVKSSFGFSDLQYEENRTIPHTVSNPAFGYGSDRSSLSLNNANRQSWIVEPQVNWSKSFGKASISFLAGGSFQNTAGSQIVHFARGFTSNSLIHDLASASSVSVPQNYDSEYRYQAFFGRANINLEDKYILNLTGRRDGSSRFGPGKQYGTFGAVGAAWVFSNTKFFKDISLLSFGKLRSSYGTTGNDQIGDYQFLDTYSSTGVLYDGLIGLEQNRLYNPDFGWESNRKFEFALETGFLNDRIFITASWYNNRSSNQLVGIPLPGTAGFSSVQANLNATVQNRGSELTLRTQNFQNTDFSWTTNFNFSMSKNKLISFPNLENSTYRNQFVVGEPLDIVKVFHYTGINPETGIYEFEDTNNDGIISESDDKQTIKDLSPKFFGGFQNQLRYKQVHLDFLFQFVKQENYNAGNTFKMPGSNNSNQLAEIGNHWQNIGDTGPYQIYSASNSTAQLAYYYFTQSDEMISDASFIRLKNVALNYDIPEEWLGNIRCRVSFAAQNLITLTKYKGADPEFEQYDRLPPLKVFTAGLQLTF